MIFSEVMEQGRVLGEALLNKLYVHYVTGWHLVARSFLELLIATLIAMTIEASFLGWKESSLRRLMVRPSRSGINDILSSLLVATGAIALVRAVFSLGGINFLSNWIKGHFDLGLGFALGDRYHLHFIVYFVCLDFVAYWHHRLMHRVPWLWELHKFHHSANEFNLITVWRDHPLERAISQLMIAFPLAILGVPQQQASGFMVFFTVLGLLKHSMLPWRWGFWGRYVFQAPIEHRIHHSPHERHFDKNFANNFVIFDHIFGTHYKGTDVNDDIGVPGTALNRNGFFYDLISCYFAGIRELRSSILYCFDRLLRRSRKAIYTKR